MRLPKRIIRFHIDEVPPESLTHDLTPDGQHALLSAALRAQVREEKWGEAECEFYPRDHYRLRVRAERQRRKNAQ